MLDEMTPRQFDEWIAYFELEAWGDDHRQNAMLMATVMNSQGGKKGGKPFTADDFLPQVVRRRDPEKEKRKLLEHLKAWVAMRQGVGRPVVS